MQTQLCVLHDSQWQQSVAVARKKLLLLSMLCRLQGEHIYFLAGAFAFAAAFAEPDPEPEALGLEPLSPDNP